MGLVGAIKYNLANLADFEGRSTRSQFWPYVAFVLVLSFVGVGAIFVPEISASLERMQQFAMENPEQATVQQGPQGYSISIRGNHPELLPDFNRLLTLTMFGFILILGLLAAAVARRLHDRGKSAKWGLMPIPFIVFASIAMPMLFNQVGSGTPNMGLFFGLFVNNLLYLASLFWLVVLLCGPTSDMNALAERS